MDETGKQPHRRDNWDWVALGSFVGAAVFGIANICNNIREKFYHAFVEGHGESRSAFSDILEKYNGKPGVPSLHAPSDGIFDALAKKFLGTKTGDTFPEAASKEYLAERQKNTLAFRQEVNNRIRDVFKIESDGIPGWTKGNWDRWKMLGHGAKREASLGFAAVAAIGFGAIAVLRHSKRTLDHIETDLDSQRNIGR